jgi:ADP-ribose pyrophosphatase
VADKIILIEQFRLVHHVRERHSAWPLEIPGGLIKVGGDPVDTARREVEEETGRSLLRLEKITEFLPAAAEFTAVIHIYVGEIEAGEGGGVHGLEEEDENIKVHVLSPRDAIKLLDTGRIGDGKTQIALHWLARHHEALRTRWLAERA